MIIESFCCSEESLKDTAIKEIRMSRLGRYVVLAGKNGAGKSRILFNLTNRMHLRDYVQPYDKTIASIRQVRFVPKARAFESPENTTRQEIHIRASETKQTSIDNIHRNCLHYIQDLQDKQWNAGHPNFRGSEEEKHQYPADYLALQNIIRAFLGVELERDSENDAAIFGKKITQASLSDGQNILLQLCVAIHAQKSTIDDSVIILDELENHLHPSAAIDLLKKLDEVAPRAQIWLATHSIPLLAYVASIEPMSIWYVNDGSVRSGGRNPSIVLTSLLGDDEQLARLSTFVGLPAQLAIINYSIECLLPPTVSNSSNQDPQVNQIHALMQSLWKNNKPLRLLDFGAGKGRLLDGLAAEFQTLEIKTEEKIDYFALDFSQEDKATCEEILKREYPDDTSPRYFNTSDEFFRSIANESIDIVLLCNVLHEISPKHWLDVLSQESPIGRGLGDQGFLLIVEDQKIPVGEKAHEFGFIVLDTPHLKTLFSIGEVDIKNGLFTVDDARNDGRLKAHLISKSLIRRVTKETIYSAIEQLRSSALEEIRAIRSDEATYKNGQLQAFWTQQFANASLASSEFR